MHTVAVSADKDSHLLVITTTSFPPLQLIILAAHSIKATETRCKFETCHILVSNLAAREPLRAFGSLFGPAGTYNCTRPGKHFLGRKGGREGGGCLFICPFSKLNCIWLGKCEPRCRQASALIISSGADRGGRVCCLACVSIKRSPTSCDITLLHLCVG